MSLKQIVVVLHQSSILGLLAIIAFYFVEAVPHLIQVAVQPLPGFAVQYHSPTQFFHAVQKSIGHPALFAAVCRQAHQVQYLLLDFVLPHRLAPLFHITMPPFCVKLPLGFQLIGVLGAHICFVLPTLGLYRLQLLFIPLAVIILNGLEPLAVFVLHRSKAIVLSLGIGLVLRSVHVQIENIIGHGSGSIVHVHAVIRIIRVFQLLHDLQQSLRHVLAVLLSIKSARVQFSQLLPSAIQRLSILGQIDRTKQSFAVVAIPIMVVSRLRLLLIGQSDCHTPQRVQNLLGVFVTHRVFRGAIQQLMSNFFCLVHDRRKGHIIVVANVVKQPFQLHHQAGCIHFAAGGLFQLSGHTLYLGLRSMVPGLQFLTVKHLAQGNVHLDQPLVIPQQRGTPGVVNALGLAAVSV